LTTRGDDGLTAFHLAAQNNRISTLELLIGLGIEVQIDDGEGYSALHCAVEKDQQDAVKLLLQKGATIESVKHPEIDSPLHITAQKKNHKMLQFILANCKNPSSVVNLPGVSGRTALHISVMKKDTKSLEILLGTEGIDINAQDKRKQTPLHLACEYQSEECGKILIERRAKLNIKDKNGNTPLHVCAANGIESLSTALIRNGAEVMALNNENKTPMHLATENEKDDVCYILQTNGADVSIRYQWSSNKKKIIVKNDEEVVTLAKSLNSFGFVETDGNKDVDPKKVKEEKRKTEKERNRSQKWAKMIKNWDEYVDKKSSKLKSRVLKGIPESLRSEGWKKLSGCDKEQNAQKYKELLLSSSEWSEQIDLDINRSFRNHIQFRERFGSGQVSLFNILKAYSVYDPEVGYCQGMSDMMAFVLMYTFEEDAFWLLVKLLNDSKYNMHGIFLPGFPLLQRAFWIFEQLFERECPKLQRHFAKENVMTMFFGTKWFMLVFLDAFPFAVTVRIWDLFLYEGYDVVFFIAIGLFKMFEKNLLSMQFDQIMGFLKSLESMDIDPDDFISFIMKNKVKTKTIRKFEEKYKAPVKRAK